MQALKEVWQNAKEDDLPFEAEEKARIEGEVLKISVSSRTCNSATRTHTRARSHTVGSGRS